MVGFFSFLMGTKQCLREMRGNYQFVVWIMVCFCKKLQGEYEIEIYLSLQWTDGNIITRAFKI